MNEPDLIALGTPAPQCESEDLLKALEAEEKRLIEASEEFTIKWTQTKHGSVGEFVEVLDKELGWKGLHYILPTLHRLRTSPRLTQIERGYLKITLSDEEVMSALNGEKKPQEEERTSLDELFHRSQKMRSSSNFAEAVAFAAKFKDYSPFNNMLVWLQNPATTFFATASHWQKAFRRTVNEDARGMLILAPQTPVVMVYDIEETDGQPLPTKFLDFTRTEGEFDPGILNLTLQNCSRDKITVQRKPLGQLYGGFATTRSINSEAKMRVVVREQLSPRDAYAVLCHELGHIYLGHLGSDADGWWPYRCSLPHRTVEMEAEAVAYIVCWRLGIKTHSADYLASYVRDNHDLDGVSVDLITRVASRIEGMGKKRLPPRKGRGKTPAKG